MQIRRRDFLSAAGAVLAAPSLALRAHASDYPTRPVKILVGFPGGNGPDIIARLLGQHLSERLGQPFVVDNRPGAASSIAVQAAVTSPPDGHTLVMLVGTNIFNMLTNPKLPFNLLNDVEPIASIADAPYFLVVNRDVPAKTIPEFVAYAKANPGKINIATGSKGSGGHVFGLFFKMLAGIDIVHVFYRNNYMSDLIAGQVQAAVVPSPQAMPFHRSGEIRLLGVSTKERLPLLPDLPTIAESVKGYDALGWYGLGGPRDIPPEIVQKLNTTMKAILTEKSIQDTFTKMGIQPMAMSSDDFGKFMVSEHKKWGQVIKDSGLTL